MRDAIRDKIQVSKEKERKEDSKIPDASDRVKKRNGKSIGLMKTKADMIQDGPDARDNPREDGT